MQQTRRTFFAAIGAAVLGKYAVKFWPQVVTHVPASPVLPQAIQEYIAACHEQAMYTFAAYLDECLLMSSSLRQNALIENIEAPGGLLDIPYYQINGNVGNYLGIPKLHRNFDPARLPA